MNIFMISYLAGKAIKITDKYIVLNVNSVGYKVFLSGSDLGKIQQNKDDVKVYTHLNVREDVLDLYGFLTEAELEFFELLITISGIGPKAALNIISTDAPSVVAGAILREDVGYLTKISGIGSKTAQKIILELKDKVSKLSFKIESGGASPDMDAIDALVSLGWNAKEAREALRNIPREIVGVEARIREAMKLLGR